MEETYNTRRYWIEIPSVSTFQFLPGQFVTLDLPIHDKPNKRWRSYSIASWPDSNVIELLIVLLEGGAGTTYLFNEVREGSEVILRGPQGVFTLPQPIERNLFFVCTGTGIAPFRSMLHHIEQHNLSHQEIYLIFGTRTQKDLLYYTEIRELQTRIPDFHFVPTLSREEWNGRSGYVHAIYEELCHQKPPAHFYLCGWKAMIDEAKKRILDLGYDKKDIHLELYG
jgi:NAD(P)H-flavin reductase